MSHEHELKSGQHKSGGKKRYNHRKATMKERKATTEASGSRDQARSPEGKPPTERAAKGGLPDRQRRSFDRSQSIL